MSMKRIILECGTGNDLYGRDYTKAACRAVQDALHHSSLSLFTTLELDRDAMRVEVTIGVQDPDAIDVSKVAAEIPYGEVLVTARRGGLDVPDTTRAPVDGVIERTVIATAAVAAYVDLPDGRFRLG
jgi:uncharacterized protein (TIGR02058 family)